MRHTFDYLVVGAGMAGEAAAQALRGADPDASIGVLGAESQPPYDRPPLSKKLWKNGKVEAIWRPIDKARAEVQLGRRATKIERAAHTVHDDQGDTWTYRKLLLATGGTPRKLSDGEGFIYYRTLDDYQRLRGVVRQGAQIAVIGGGFIGSEVAAAMRMNDCRVTMLFPETGIGARVYPRALSDSVTAYYLEQGVEIRAGVTVRQGRSEGKRWQLTLSDGSTLDADAVVAGLGIVPDVQLADAAGLKVDNGIIVDAHLRTSDPDIFAAGDVAVFPAPALGRSIRVEHENGALSMGTHAGQCMAGVDAPYEELPYFYSDLFDLGYEAVGVLDPRLETVEQWAAPYREGVVYYLEGGRVRGVLLWNTWGQVDAARSLIAESGPFDAKNVRDRLPVAP